MRIIDYEDTVYNPILKTNTKSFVNKQSLKGFLQDKYKTKIPVGLEYRPDLIAKQFLGDESLAWLITYVNNFTNGVKDYTPNKSIYIPNI